MLNKKPYHIAIVPDGNRRWARAKGLKPWIGHQYATENLKKIFEAALDIKIPYFSFWASSQDNLAKRPKAENKFLLNLFKKEFAKLAIDKRIHKEQVRVNIFGEWRKQFPEEVKKPMKRAIETTKNYNKFFLNFFIAYSGIDEMLKAIRKISKQNLDNPDFKITPQLIKKYLFTKDLPRVDYLIRTGGEPHMSAGFMMWDIADAQMYFSDKSWPDFTANDFKKAIQEYSRRQRRFGA